MIKNPSKRPPKTQDPELNRILSTVYDDINELTSSINRRHETNLPAKTGDIKVVDKIISYHTGDKWKAIDIDKINRSLFPLLGDGGEDDGGDGVDLTPLQTQITNNKRRAMLALFWGTN